MRVALFGLGHMGRHHARHLRARGDVELVIIDPALGHPEGGVGEGGAGRFDAAVIATPTDTHEAVAATLLAAGVPCLVEKPLAPTVAAATRLAASPQVMVGHIERFNPAFAPVASSDARFVQAERLAAWGRRGVIPPSPNPTSGPASGDIASGLASASSTSASSASASSTSAAVAPAPPPVDVILDLMVHDLDLFLLLAGEDPVVEVRANGLSVVTGQIDIAQARVQTAAGRVGTFTASRVSRAPSRRFRVFTPGEYWSLDLGAKVAARVRWGEDGLQEELVPVAGHDALAAQLAAFLAFARGEAPNPVPGAAGLAALDLALRVRDAIG